MSTKFNVKNAIERLNQEAREVGTLGIIDKGFEILPEEYHDFWYWLFDEKEFYENEKLCRIGGYVPSEEVENNKRALYEYVNSPSLGLGWETPKLQFFYDMPEQTYEECRKEVAVGIEEKRREDLKVLYEWSRGFDRYVSNPLSATFLAERTEKEMVIFLRNIDRLVLAKAMLLYPHNVREKILHGCSDRLQIVFLEDMQYFSQDHIVSLNECVEAEKNVQCVIERLWETETDHS